MNERVPDSSGLPLRAMVMVLLFLGVIFLLVGFQAIGSSNDSSDDGTSVPTVSASSTAAPTSSASPAPVAKARLRDGGWNVTETGNLTLPDVTATTVYFGETAGERESADEVGKLLAAPVEPRVPAVAEQPPGVIVVVTG
jgi:hypothetical protein